MSKRANIFFFIVDGLRYDSFEFYGCSRPTTPFYSGLMESGTFFSNAFTTGTWTLPVHMTYLTGLNTFQHNVDYALERTCPFPNQFQFLPALLKQADYTSLVTSEQIFLSPKLYTDLTMKKCVYPGFMPPDCCGFDYMNCLFDHVGKKALLIEEKKVTFYDALEGVASRKPESELTTRNWERFDELVQQVDPAQEEWPDLEPMLRESGYFESRYNLVNKMFGPEGEGDAEQPHFIMVNFNVDGGNYAPELRKRWFQEYFRLNLGVEVKREELDFFDFSCAAWFHKGVSLATWDLIHCWDLSFIDANSKLLYELFEAKGMLTEDDYFLWLADHGQGKGETRMSPRECHHGAFPFDWIVHVPIFARGPEFAELGRVIDKPISTIDIYPTIAAMAGVEVPAGYAHYLRGKPLQQRVREGDYFDEIVIETMVYVNDKNECVMPVGGSFTENWARHCPAYCMVDGNERLVCVPAKKIVQLFDVAQDPLYERPMESADEIAPALTKLQTILEAQQAADSAPLAAVKRTAKPVTEQTEDGEVDETVVASLKALGYY
ncbi:MAG: sulfatase-like hydrolase/transferase [Sedimentisphaerales bacterium]|nr:sulfatase-like hydrolase/transferase [Sedimentisphaerales bacterium]